MFLKTGKINVCPSCFDQEYSNRLEREYPRRVSEDHEGPHTSEMKRIQLRKSIVTTEKDGKWSRKFVRCVKCGGNDVKHVARGLCLSCYEKETEKRNRGKQRLMKGWASNRLGREYLYQEYVNKKRSLIDIAKDSDCTRQYVYKRLREFKIPLRTRKEARELVLARQKIAFKVFAEDGNERLIIPGSIKINEDFFRHWSNEMAYVLGVIYTDGHINPGRKLDHFQKTTTMSPRLVITQKEPELLSKVSKLMDCNMKLRYRKQLGIAGAIYVFDVCSEKIYDDLVSFGLSPQKSKTMEFPNIPQEFVRHFIRGCWDGDGSVFVDRGSIKASYISGSIKFIERLVDELYKIGISRTNVPYKFENGIRVRDPVAKEMLSKYPDGRLPLRIFKHPKANAFYIRIVTKETIEKLFHYFYDRVDESMYLCRKYNVFIKGLKLEEREESEQLRLDLDFS